MRRRINTEAVS